MAFAKGPLDSHTRAELVEWFEYTAGAKSYGSKHDSHEKVRKDLDKILRSKKTKSRDQTLKKFFSEHGMKYKDYQSFFKDIKEDDFMKGSFLYRMSNLSLSHWLDLTLVSLGTGVATGDALGADFLNLVKLSPGWLKELANLVGEPSKIINTKVGTKIGFKAMGITSAPIVEEIVLRGIVQELILKKIPKEVLKAFGVNPKILDKPPFRVARIVISSLLFALMHAHTGAAEVGTLPQFIGGIFLGSAMEATGRLTIPMLMHGFLNGVIDVFYEMFYYNSYLSPLALGLILFFTVAHFTNVFEAFSDLGTLKGFPLVVPLGEFSTWRKNTTYLKCEYDVSDKGVPKFKSYALNGDQSVDTGKSEGTKDEDYLLVQGRWIEKGQGFLTLGSEAIFKKVCSGALTREHKNLDTKNINVEKIHFAVGNTRWSDNYKLLFYRPMPKHGLQDKKHPEEAPGLYDQLYQDPVAFCKSIGRRCKGPDWVAVFTEVP
jgi:membrane protease YdiL (CAAX protease family)